MLLLLLGIGCADDPCLGVEGARLRVYPESTFEDHSGDPWAFPSISSALAHAEADATVCVAPGRYQDSLQVQVPGIRILAVDAVLTPPADAGDPRDGSFTLLSVLAEDLWVMGLDLRGGQRGVWVAEDASLTLEGLSIEENATGIVAAGDLTLLDVEVARNPEGGVLVAGSGAPLRIEGGRVAGNGTAGHSPVGGVHSERPVRASGVELLDNAGTEAADLWTAGQLDLSVARVGWSQAEGGAPRLVAEAGARLRQVEAVTTGSPLLAVSCAAGGSIEAQNVALVENGGASALRSDSCSGEIQHLTLVGAGGSALELWGSGELNLENNAFAGWDRAVDASGAMVLHRGRAFEGTIAEAGLLRAIPGSPDLRPQSDSPLLDRAAPSAVTEDLGGEARPQGAGADLGAWERS